jgi:hypothetical protein
MNTNIHCWPYLTQFFLEWEMFQIKVVDKIKKHFLCSTSFFEDHAIYNTVNWKGYRWQYNMMHVYCMLDTKGYIQTLRIRNTYCLSNTTVGAQLHFNQYSIRRTKACLVNNYRESCLGCSSPPCYVVLYAWHWIVSSALA